MRYYLLCLVSVPLLLSQTADEKEDLKNPLAGQAEAIATGRALYLESCSGCHGPTAEGGRGRKLAKDDQVRGATNRHLLSVIQDGVKGSEMPPFHLPVEKAWQIIAYLRNLTAVAFEGTGPAMRPRAPRSSSAKPDARSATRSAAAAVRPVRTCLTSDGPACARSCVNRCSIRMPKSLTATAASPSPPMTAASSRVWRATTPITPSSFWTRGEIHRLQ